ncbi:transposase [Kyrpidia spormannii]|uniref:Transposase n=2 Tax=Kyrpidia spormannii TaxID=2055160 RepID=A0ACA8ZBJ6_9BACL
MKILKSLRFRLEPTTEQAQNFSKSAKGTRENPGKNVRAKSGLNKAILDQGWSLFQTFLGYKLHWSGGRDGDRTGTVHEPALWATPSQSPCEQCGYEANADTVGTMNILRAGPARIACFPV